MDLIRRTHECNYFPATYAILLQVPLHTLRTQHCFLSTKSLLVAFQPMLRGPTVSSWA